MSSSGNSGPDNQDTNQERHPVDLAAKPPLKSSMESARSSPQVQTSGQLRSVSGATRIQGGIQTAITSCPIGVARTTLAVCTATSAAPLVQGGTIVSTRPSVVPASSPVSVQTNAPLAATHISTTYHVPPGAAAVANIAAPRSAVATPIVRATTNLQSGVSAQHSASYASGLRGLGSGTLLPRAPSPAAQGTWMSGSASAASTASLHIAEKGYFKPSVSVQSSLGGVSIAQVLPARTQASSLTYTNPLTSTVTHFPVTSGSSQGTTTLVATQQHQLTLSQGVTNATVGGQGSTTVLATPARLTVSSLPGTGLSTQGTVLTAATSTQRSGQVSNATVLTAPTRLSVSTSNQSSGSSQVTTRLTVAGTGSSQNFGLAATPSSAAQGTIIASPARITSSVLASGQGTALLTGPARLAMTSNLSGSGHNAVISAGQARLQAASSSVPTAIAASSTQGTILGAPTRIAVSASSVGTSVQQGTGVLSSQTRLTVSANSAISNSGQNTLITAPTRLAVSSTSSITPSTGHQGATVLTGPARLTVTSGVANSGVVSIHPLVVSNTNPNIAIKSTPQNQLAASGNRSISAHQNLGPKVITQPAHGPSIQITQVPVGSVAGKLPPSLHSVTPLQTAIAITTGASGVTRTVAYTTTATISTSSISGIRPVTVATPSTIPVAKVFPQAVGIGREQIGTNSVSEVTLPVHTIQAPQQAQPQSQQAMVASQQTISQATNVYIQTSHRTSPAPSSTQASADRTGTNLPTYTLPTTYYYEAPSAYQVTGIGSSLVARPYTPGNPYTVQTTTTPALRPGVTTHHVHSIVTGTQPVRFNPVMVVDSTRTSMPSFVTEGTVVQAEGSVLAQSSQMQPTSKPNASPRPSILRKRDNEGSPLKAQKNLAPVLAALSSGAPVSPPSPRRPDSRGNGGNSSGGSTTISATSSPGLGEGGDDSLPPIKQEPIEEGDRPPESEEKIYIPKRPNISLINSYRHTWKSRHNHYLRYSDVKPKDERRPTVTDLANQKQSDLEMQVFEKLSTMLKIMEKKAGKDLEKDANRVNELIKGNMQRSKVIKDQMQEAKSQVMKIFDHKSHVADIIGRCANKRALKKRDKS
ncbi:hypothetical protein C0J52_05248 [Blattella germanica]|nr:hypothetical protein C0J52_05248 [Blattella germanica]